MLSHLPLPPHSLECIDPAHQEFVIARLTEAWRNALGAGLDPSRLILELRQTDDARRPPSQSAAVLPFPGENMPDCPPYQPTWSLSVQAVPLQPCFVVTAERAGSPISVRTQKFFPPDPRPVASLPAHVTSPQWDSGRRTLLYGGLIVKEFRQRAANQVLILAAFQELEWPRRIDDPLPRGRGMVAKQRLRETIRSLNTFQRNPLLTFKADGTGTGVAWCGRS
jgi:hypothetical protein